MILESVSVLQHEVREGGIGDVELPMLRTVLTPLAASDVLPGVAVEPLAHVALGGLYGAALFIARSPDPEAARARGRRGARHPHRGTAGGGDRRVWPTSELARRAGVSVPSASEHATVLRQADLITTARVGRAVLHTVTPLGGNLLSADGVACTQASHGRGTVNRDASPSPGV